MPPAPRPRPKGTPPAEPPPWSFEALLRELVDEQHYPRLHRIAWSADIGSDPSGFEERQEFHFGLDRILDGVESSSTKATPLTCVTRWHYICSYSCLGAVRR